jgi:hypothetical protein
MDLKSHTIDKNALFKQCTTCGFEWASREHFLEDPNVAIIGYQVNFDELEAGIFLFNHSCGTTLGIYAHAFNSLYDGPLFVERATGTEECPEFCLHQHDMRPCPAQCECAYVREIIQVIKEWPKGLKEH